MIAIWKFPLQVTDEQLLVMPSDAEVLSVQMQQGVLCLWAKLETKRPCSQRRVRIVGTGNPCVDVGRYVGTVQQYDGALIWHVFEGEAVGAGTRPEGT